MERTTFHRLLLYLILNPWRCLPFALIHYHRDTELLFYSLGYFKVHSKTGRMQVWWKSVCDVSPGCSVYREQYYCLWQRHQEKMKDLCVCLSSFPLKFPPRDPPISAAE